MNLYKPRVLFCLCILIAFYAISFFSYNTKECFVDERLYQNHFVAHGRTNSEPFPDNSLILFETLISKGYEAVECDVFFTKDTVPVLCHESNIGIASKEHFDIEISEINYNELLQYSFSTQDSGYVPITTLEQLIKLAADNHILVQMDLAKLSFEQNQYKQIYGILVKYNMTKSCIWEIKEKDFFKIADLDNTLIFQIDETWDRTNLTKLLMKKRFCSLIICSSWFEPLHHFADEDFINYERIVSFGKRLGFQMKVATINDKEIAKRFLSIGVNLITTDCLYDEVDAKK